MTVADDRNDASVEAARCPPFEQAAASRAIAAVPATQDIPMIFLYILIF